MVSSVPRKAREPRLQRLVHVLRAADEAHRGHAVAVAVERRLAGRDQRRMVGEAEVVVGAEVQHLRRRARRRSGRPAARR